ncbi:MAG: hypothetical protein M5U28_18105 [Sandaracinaceae bacterium]|nr:hypothetical protein [Sandaracinaceae bacterium]
MHLALRCLVALVLAPSAARAEYWAMDMSELLGTAREILVVEVPPGGARAVVRESIRGRAAGEPVELAIADTPPPAGTRMLVVCEGGVCPRAWGADRGGYYVLEAQEPGDGASVLPGLLDAASLRALASGRPAPELCVRASVRLLDEPRPLRVEARLSAGDGTGTARMGTDTMRARPARAARARRGRARLGAPAPRRARWRPSSRCRGRSRSPVGPCVALRTAASSSMPCRRSHSCAPRRSGVPRWPGGGATTCSRADASSRPEPALSRAASTRSRSARPRTGRSSWSRPSSRGAASATDRSSRGGGASASRSSGARRIRSSRSRWRTPPIHPGSRSSPCSRCARGRGTLSLPIAVYGGRERAPAGRIELRYVPASP